MALVAGTVPFVVPPRAAVAVQASSCTPTPPGPAIGYLLAAADGGVFAFGGARYVGGLPGITYRPKPIAPTVAIAGHPRGYGYWLATSDGGLLGFGTRAPDTRQVGSGIAGLAVTPTQNGWWLASGDGSVFALGDAPFLGGVNGRPAGAAPIVGMAATTSGRGYWLVAADGGVFAFGDARFFGSMGGTRLRAPVVGMGATPTGAGYWLVGRDGGIFAFGDARYFGSTGSLRLTKAVVGMAASPTGVGYWLVASDGGVFSFGDARFFGSTGAVKLASPIVGIAAEPGLTRCAEWPSSSPPDPRLSVSADPDHAPADGEAFFTVNVENQGGDPAYVQRFDTTLVDHAGRTVWSPNACGYSSPAILFGGRQLAPRQTATSRFRYPTENDLPMPDRCPAASEIPPGSYDLVGTLTWCAKAHQADDGWWCDEPTTTQTEHVAVEITQPTNQ
jgi:hypothetical protein